MFQARAAAQQSHSRARAVRWRVLGAKIKPLVVRWESLLVVDKGALHQSDEGVASLGRGPSHRA